MRQFLAKRGRSVHSDAFTQSILGMCDNHVSQMSSGTDVSRPQYPTLVGAQACSGPLVCSLSYPAVGIVRPPA